MATGGEDEIQWAAEREGGGRILVVAMVEQSGSFNPHTKRERPIIQGTEKPRAPQPYPRHVLEWGCVVIQHELIGKGTRTGSSTSPQM